MPDRHIGVIPDCRYARRTNTNNRAKSILKERPDPGAKEKEEKKCIFCKNCNHKITTFENIIPIDGLYHHTCKNPVGLVFQIGCFKDAEGCVIYGEPTEDHTWFPGFSWSFAHCSQCNRHLGWFYQDNGRSFFGLILHNLS